MRSLGPRGFIASHFLWYVTGCAAVELEDEEAEEKEGKTDGPGR